jgi:hypothetical protein
VKELLAGFKRLLGLGCVEDVLGVHPAVMSALSAKVASRTQQ